MRVALVSFAVALAVTAPGKGDARASSGKRAAAALAPGSVFRDCQSACPEMVVVPAGAFVSGDPPEREPVADVGPQGPVTIAHPFAIGRYDVTVAEYRAFVEDTGRGEAGNCLTSRDGSSSLVFVPTGTWRNPGFPQTDRDPVVCVVWDDAKAYVGWLSRKTGHAYRLPSESEWEYAARANTKSRYLWGDDEKDVCTHANFADARYSARFSNGYAAGCDDGYIYTSPVGSFPPNGFGLYDMAGDVSQWLEDCSGGGIPLDDGSPYLGGACDARLVHGGNWVSPAFTLRPALSHPALTTFRTAFIGFRVARSVD